MNKAIARGVVITPLLFLAMTAVANAETVSDTFQVRITIEKSCTVTAGSASDIDLGAHPATDTDIAGNNTISVNCSKTTPYFIGLLPSNADTTGAGEMSSTSGGGNTDLVPYQLRSTAGMAGTIWGDTATATAVGNGVAGTGTGNAITHTVYATVASANFTPDSYADTVTVHVNF